MSPLQLLLPPSSCASPASRLSSFPAADRDSRFDHYATHSLPCLPAEKATIRTMVRQCRKSVMRPPSTLRVFRRTDISLCRVSQRWFWNNCAGSPLYIIQNLIARSLVLFQSFTRLDGSVARTPPPLVIPIGSFDSGAVGCSCFIEPFRVYSTMLFRFSVLGPCFVLFPLGQHPVSLLVVFPRCMILETAIAVERTQWSISAFCANPELVFLVYRIALLGHAPWASASGIGKPLLLRALLLRLLPLPARRGSDGIRFLRRDGGVEDRLWNDL